MNEQKGHSAQGAAEREASGRTMHFSWRGKLGPEPARERGGKGSVARAFAGEEGKRLREFSLVSRVLSVRKNGRVRRGTMNLA